MSEQKTNENDLNDLLDNALQDFDKTLGKNEKKEQDADNISGNTVNSEADGNESADAFFLEQAKILANRMSTLFGDNETPSGDVPPLPQDPDQILAGFKKMAEAAAMTLSGANPASDDEVAKFSSSIASALKGLQEGSENLSAPVSEDDVANMFGSLNLDGSSDGENNAFLPFMEGMMQSLLSAEILLPSIKDLLEKYPKYLEENADTLSIEDKERYEKQLELYKIIEGHLESESPNDSPAVKREKFRVVLEDMRNLQNYGQPPAEIISESAGNLPFGDAATGGVNPQCPTM